MKRIFVQTQSARDWKRLLAQPERHWKKGFSAMTTAVSWEDAADKLPAEIEATLVSAQVPALAGLVLLLALPEWHVALEGGDRASQTDVLAIARNKLGLVILAVEAKVDEEFGPILGEKRKEVSPGQEKRLTYLHSVLSMADPLPDSIRYQLLHRAASAVLTARDFHAATAVLVVQSFSPESRWREDFDAFASALGARQLNANVWQVPGLDRPTLHLAWCRGDQRFREVDVPANPG